MSRRLSGFEHSAPLISVVMSSYNSEKYIEDCLNSLLSQTYENFEVIIVDCSTDTTLSKIHQYEDSRIRVHHVLEKITPAEARNKAIADASGEYIALMDSDDVCEPIRLEAQVLHMKQVRADVCSSYFYEVNSVTGRVRKSKQATNDADIRALLTIYNPVCNPSVMIRAAVLRRPAYRTDYLYSEDSEMWCELALRAKFTCCPMFLLRYRVHAEQMSQQFNLEALKWFRKASNEYLERLLGQPWEPTRTSFLERVRNSLKKLILLNRVIPGVSLGANAQLYSRLQLKSHAPLNPILRIERYLVALYLTILGRVYKYSLRG